MEAFLAEKSLDAGELPWYTETRGIFFCGNSNDPRKGLWIILKKICRVTLLFWKCTNVNRKIRKNMCHDQSSHD